MNNLLLTIALLLTNAVLLLMVGWLHRIHVKVDDSLFWVVLNIKDSTDTVKEAIEKDGRFTRRRIGQMKTRQSWSHKRELKDLKAEKKEV